MKCSNLTDYGMCRELGYECGTHDPVSCVYLQSRGHKVDLNQLECPKCGGQRVYLMSDSYNEWCPDCGSIVS